VKGEGTKKGGQKERLASREVREGEEGAQGRLEHGCTAITAGTARKAGARRCEAGFGMSWDEN